jgi:rhodanese-related sulfurtransferase
MIDVTQLNVDEAASASGAFLLDVREDDEWDAGHAPTANHIPLSDVPDHLADLPQDRQILCVCRSGGRSNRAAAYLADRGFATANVAGGMQAWAAAGLELVGASPPQII